MALDPAFQADASSIRAFTIEEVEHVREPQKASEGNIYLVPGHPLLISFERGLTGETGNAGFVVQGVLRLFATLTAEELGCEIVLVDLGPSSGVLNRAFVMNCDFVLPPAKPDALTFASTDGLFNVVLPAFFEWREKLVEQQREKSLPQHVQRFLLPERPPCVLPILMIGYKLRKSKRGDITRKSSASILAFQELMGNIRKSSDPRIQRIRLLTARALLRGVVFEDQLVLPIMQDLGDLQQLASQLKLSIYDMTPTLLKSHDLGQKSYPKTLKTAHDHLTSFAAWLLYIARL